MWQLPFCRIAFKQKIVLLHLSHVKIEKGALDKDF